MSEAIETFGAGSSVLGDRSAPTTRAAAGPAVVALTYAQEVLADSPRGYWKFNEGSGTSITDYSGNNLTLATTNTPALTDAGPITGETCITLVAASSQYASVADNNLLDLGDTWTIEYWIKLGTAGAQQYVLCKGANAYAAMYGATGNTFQMQRRGAANLDRTANTYSTTGVWYHVVHTKSGATMHSYVNGSVDEAAVGDSTCTNNTTALFIGQSSGNNNYLNGSLAHVALYPTALSAARAAAHYAARV